MLNRRQRGFSLVELIIALAIISILAAIAIPSFTTMLRNNKLTGAGQTLFYSLQYARSEAIKRNTPVYFSFLTGTNWCYGMNTGSACSCSVATTCNLGAVSANGSSTLGLTTSGLTGSSFTFEPDHGATNISGTITYTINGQTTAMSVKIGMLGSIQICSSQISGYQACS